MALPTFIWGNGGARLTPEQVAREREIANSLIKGGIDTSPVGHWTQGAARMAQALAGNIREGWAADAESAGRDEWQKQFNSAFGIGGDTPAVAADPSAPVSLTAPVVAAAEDQMPVWQNAIAGIESGGKYDAVGPTHPKMGRALGKYQVMESNVGPWSQAALGRTVTPDEFLASPEIQDAVFKNQFGQYVNQYGGDATKAAQAWFAGPGGVGTNRADSLGTTVPQYAQKFASAVGGASPVAASLANAGGSPQQQQIPLRNLMGLATSPWAPAGAQGVIQALVQQQMQQSDPMRQLQMQKLQRDINAPVKRNTTTIDGRLVDADTGAVIQDFGQRATPAIQNYKFYSDGERAAGRTPLGPLEYEQAVRKSGATNISTGTIPAGYEQFTDPATGAIRMRPIPGGPEDTSKADAAKSQSRETSTSIITNAAARAREAMSSRGLPATGTVGMAASYLPESNAAELRRQVDVLQANAKIENLQAMRAASPTGGALGAVSDKESAMLAAKSGALDPNSPNFARDLEDYERTLLRIVHGQTEGDKIFEASRGGAPKARVINGYKIEQVD